MAARDLIGKRGERRLVVRVDATDVRRMVQCPVPTYLVGVDEPGEQAYVVSIHGRLTGPIDCVDADKVPSERRELEETLG